MNLGSVRRRKSEVNAAIPLRADLGPDLKGLCIPFIYTVYPRSSDPFYIASYKEKWVTSALTYGDTDLFRLICYIPIE